MNQEEEEFLEANKLIRQLSGQDICLNNYIVDTRRLNEYSNFDKANANIYAYETFALNNDIKFVLRHLVYGGEQSGRKVWAEASLLISHLISTDLKSFITDKSIIELGCGCSGLPSLTALNSGAKSVIFTDYDKDALEDLKFNIQNNINHDLSNKYSILHYDWNDLKDQIEIKFDIIIGCEIVYEYINIYELVFTIERLINDSGYFFWIQAINGRGKVQDFMNLMRERKFLTKSWKDNNFDIDLSRSTYLYDFTFINQNDIIFCIFYKEKNTNN